MIATGKEYTHIYVGALLLGSGLTLQTLWLTSKVAEGSLGLTGIVATLLGLVIAHRGIRAAEATTKRTEAYVRELQERATTPHHFRRSTSLPHTAAGRACVRCSTCAAWLRRHWEHAPIGKVVGSLRSRSRST